MNLGTILRATRCCFAYSRERDCLVRVQPGEPDTKTVLVEVKPPTAVLEETSPKVYYYYPVDADSVMDASPVLQGISHPNACYWFVLDEEGRGERVGYQLGEMQ